MPTTPASDVVLRALSIGAAASEALSRAGAALRVHSVFRSTMNLVVEGTDTLVALTGAAGLPYAHAVVLAEDEDFRSWPHPAGSTGLLDGAFLRLRWRGNSRAVDLGRARRQPSRLLPSVRRRGSAWRACARTLSRFQADHGCDLLLSGLSGSAGAATVMGEALHRSARALGAAISADGAPPAAVRHAVSSLAGKGTGLTPSGDDFLCGFMAAARCAGGRTNATGYRGGGNAAGGGGPALASTLGEAVQESIRSTSDISASMLRCALRGQWPTPLADLADALAEERQFEALRALGDLCGLGHSSGADIATGFLYGLRVLT